MLQLSKFPAPPPTYTPPFFNFLQNLKIWRRPMNCKTTTTEVNENGGDQTYGGEQHFAQQVERGLVVPQVRPARSRPPASHHIWNPVGPGPPGCQRREGMEEKSLEFKEKGGEIYVGE